jgi:putative FmdB family regulatory protein
MPTYDYRCLACGHATEIFHSIHARPKRKCPACGKSRLERQIGAGAGVIFKGSGFYQTDYRSKAYHEAAKAERGDAAPSKSGGGADASATPAPSSDTSSPGSSSSNGKAENPKPAAPKKSDAAKPAKRPKG